MTHKGANRRIRTSTPWRREARHAADKKPIRRPAPAATFRTRHFVKFYSGSREIRAVKIYSRASDAQSAHVYRDASRRICNARTIAARSKRGVLLEGLSEAPVRARFNAT